MKAAATLMVLIIIAFMVVSVGLMVWVYVSGFSMQVRQAGENRTVRSLEVLSSCIKIEEAFQNKFFIRNCGNGLITNETLSIYVDGEPFSFDLDPISIDGGKIGSIVLHDMWRVSIGQHSLRVVNPNTEALTYFESLLPDSCILYFNFDEGIGTVAHDSSGHGNDGTLHNGTETCFNGYCPKWVDGKFGKALDFDGLGDFVEATDIPNTDLTIMAWVHPKKISGDERVIVSKFKFPDYPDYEWSFRLTYIGSGISQFQFYTIDQFNLAWREHIIPLNEWSHFTVVYDRANEQAEFYSNLESLGSGGQVGQIRDTIQPVRVGAQGGGSFDYFNGTIDEVRIYNEVLDPKKTLNFRII